MDKFAALKRIWYYVDRYSAVVLFPTGALAAIYADYNYTKKWKDQQNQLPS